MQGFFLTFGNKAYIITKADKALKASRMKPDASEGGKTMSEIRVKENESLESALPF